MEKLQAKGLSKATTSTVALAVSLPALAVILTVPLPLGTRTPSSKIGDLRIGSRKCDLGNLSGGEAILLFHGDDPMTGLGTVQGQLGWKDNEPVRRDGESGSKEAAAEKPRPGAKLDESSAWFFSV